MTADTPPDPAAPGRRVARALDALRHGWAIRIEHDAGDQSGALDLLPAETGYAQAGVFAARMLISTARAATLKLANLREFDPAAPVMIRGYEPFSLTTARDLADPARDLGSPLRGPFRADPLPDVAVARTAMELARLAGILPAFLIATGDAVAVTVTPDDLRQFRDAMALTIQARAHLPVAAAENAEIIAFRARDDVREHVALIIGTQDHDRVPLVRLHSECLTGDILGSLKCDCGPQLDEALQAMAAEAAQGGWGVLLYLRQEGRGIGLINKLRAYQLQDQGFDTVDANERLGLPNEARDFPVAARMLDLLAVPAIRLMTNNPAKVDALRAVGVDVIERVPHQLPANPHNHRYLATKRDRSGHLLT